MHQLTYTSCRPGMSLNGSGGYTVRAASPKLDQAWVACAPQLARYEVSSSKGGAGARLAFHRRQDAAIVTHSLSVRDHDSRPASLTHAVIDPTGQLGASDAISMWGSPFWQRADDGGTTELPWVASLPANGALDWPSVQRRLQDERFYAMSEFLLSTWLRRHGRPIVLLADAEPVAAAVWLLTRCLPAPTLRDLTFASQDHDPATAGVTVVGYGRATNSLPAPVLAARHWFDLGTRERSGESLEPYAHFACREILAGRWHTVEAFLGLCSDMDVYGTEAINLVHRVIHESHVCTEQEIQQVWERPRLLRWLLQDQRHAEIAVTTLARGTTAAARDADALVAAFSETPERAQTLVRGLLGQAGAALAQNDLQRAAHLVGLCGGTKGTPAPSALWSHVVGQVGINALLIETRIGLAGVLKGVGADSATRTLVAHLLTVSLEDVPVVLRCTAHASLKAESCRIAMSGSKAMTHATIKALASQPDVLMHLLRTAADPTAIACDIAASEPVAVLDVLVVDDAVRHRIDADAVIDYVVDVGKLDFRQLASTAFARYWGLLLRGRHADNIVSEMLRLPIANVEGRGAGRHLRSALRRASVSKAVSGAMNRRLRLLEVIDAPSGPIDFPEEVMGAIADLPPTDRRTVSLQLLPRLAASVADGTLAMLCQNLSMLMELAASPARRGTVATLREFAKASLANGRLLADASVATVTIAYAFGAAGSPLESPAERDQLVDFGVELTILFARAGGPSLNRRVNEHAMGWPEPARTLFRLARQRRRINGPLLARFARSHATLMEC